ncbi:MAG: hypothetical protein ACLR3C_15400 [Eggerthella lenta]
MMEARTRPFFSVFRAEVLKGRRGAPRKVALIAPLPFCALGVLSSGVIPGTGATGGVATYLWNFWYVLMMPVAIALICVSVANIDARQKLRSVLALPFPPARTWWAKVCYALAFAASLAVLVCSTAGRWAVPRFCEGSRGDHLDGCEFVDGSCGAGVTVRFGTLAGIAFRCWQLGRVSRASSAAWFAFPPATTLCAVSPSGVAPSGVPLEAGEALGAFGWEAVVGIVVAAVLFAVWHGLGRRGSRSAGCLMAGRRRARGEAGTRACRRSPVRRAWFRRALRSEAVRMRRSPLWCCMALAVALGALAELLLRVLGMGFPAGNRRVLQLLGAGAPLRRAYPAAWRRMPSSGRARARTCWACRRARRWRRNWRRCWRCA